MILAGLTRRKAGGNGARYNMQGSTLAPDRAATAHQTAEFTMKPVSPSALVLRASLVTAFMALSGPVHAVDRTAPAPASAENSSQRVIFTACHDNIGCEPWITDGTRAGTGLLRRLGRGERDSRPGAYTDLGDGRVAFNANPPFAASSFPRAPYITDGTRPGTELVWRMPSRHNSPGLFTATGDGRYVFRTSFYRNRWMQAVWVSDGTRDGTILLRSFDAPTSAHYPGSFTQLRSGVVLFVVNDGRRGRELWGTDGTRAGTRPVINLTGDSNSSSPNRLTRIAEGLVVFVADDGVHGEQLWATDGTRQGTTMLTQHDAEASDLRPAHITALGDGQAMFTTGDGELWITDGTAAGTRIFTDPEHRRRPRNPAGFTPIGDGRVLFSAELPSGEIRLWVTDGTAEGTQVVRRVEAHYRAEHMRALGDGRVVFWQYHESHQHYALWVSDGTREGTRRVRRFPELSWIHDDLRASMTSLGNGLALFPYDNGRMGWEPWVTDGTGPGTRVLRNISRTGHSMPSDVGFQFTPFRMVQPD